MSIISIDGELLKKMIISGANALEKNKEEVDALNVFPVPDGDTGTNMSLTFLAAAKEVEKLSEPTVYDVAKAVSNGSLRGARGNSGVILSQLFRGFAKGLEGCEEASASDISNAFTKASEMAYKAVMKPKEGTILTIARAMAERASDMSFDTDDADLLLFEVIKYGKEVLAQTTDMLPELKQASVVDAGGYGLLCIWDAAYVSMSAPGEAYIYAPAKTKESAAGEIKLPVFSSILTEDIKFAYCTEFFIRTKNATEETEGRLKKYLSAIGDSIVAAADDDMIKIHVHTNNPGAVLEKALAIGYLDNIKIENMHIQHTNKIDFEQSSILDTNNKEEKKAESDNKDNDIENKNIGFIAVSSGAGFKELFISLGADIVVEGGQSMNPSTEDFIEAIESVEADNIIIFPNNKNIILSANQAASLTEDKNITVIPTKSIPQGVSALLNYSELKSVQENAKQMEDLIKHVRTGQITYAVRATVIEDKEIKEGDILCMVDGKIELVAQSLQPGAKALLDIMLKDGGEVLSIFYGEAATSETAQELLEYVSDKYTDVEAEVQNGGQPIYHYIFSVE